MHKLLEEQNKSKKMSEENTGIHKKERVKIHLTPFGKRSK
jgi:hypothetical protein